MDVVTLYKSKKNFFLLENKIWKFEIEWLLDLKATFCYYTMGGHFKTLLKIFNLSFAQAHEKNDRVKLKSIKI